MSSLRACVILLGVAMGCLTTPSARTAPPSQDTRTISPRPVDYWPTESWRSSTPEAQGMASGKLADMLEWLQVMGYTLDSITIIRDGYLVLDAYFYPFKKGEKHIIRMPWLEAVRPVMRLLGGPVG